MNRHKSIGMTLIEMLLILVIASSILLLILNYSTEKMDKLRRDRAALQMEQILNAAVAYYVVNGYWPKDNVGVFPASLQTAGFLPNGTLNNPWGNNFLIVQFPTNPAGDVSTGGFYSYINSPIFTISTTVPTNMEAQMIAASLPFGQVVSGTTVQASVSVPGQNYNNARSVNFAGVYASGSCVPAPACPSMITPSGPQLMTPAIFVMPVQTYGAYAPPASGIQSIIPITGYTAYATPLGLVKTDKSTTIASCDGTIANAPCYESAGVVMPTNHDPSTHVFTSPPGAYYRVCLSVQTKQGPVDQASMGNVLAITRCVPATNNPYSNGTPAVGELIGTPFNVWSQ